MPRFSLGRDSIRTRLLGWLLTAVVLGALIGAALTYRTIRSELEAQFDYQLRQMALSLRDQGSVSPEDAAAIADGQLDFIVQIWSLDGVRIYAPRTPRGFPLQTVLGFSQVVVAGTTWRVFSVAARDRVIEVAQPLDVRRNLAAQAALRSVAPMLIAAPLLAALVWWTVGASLAPLERVAAQVKARGAGALEPLADTGSPDEIAPLTDAINALLERLRASFAAQRDFVADAAHELRSPLTALKLQLGLLDRAQDEGARRAAFEALGAGIERATRLVEQLLTLARSEPGVQAFDPIAVDLPEAVRLAVSDVIPLAHARGIELSLRAPEAQAALTVIGDAASLRILARNLADNAVRYTPSGGQVRVALEQRGGQALLTVDDSGPGIPAGERERVFDRFYRGRVADTQREVPSAAETGSGLGLAIVRAIALRHRALVQLGDSPLGGLRVQIEFPGR
jgi:two-component system OmpR family sensor kinase/two-component system sensor histidine kinase QseC